MCYQVMETEDRGLLDEWMRNWEDLTEFEVIEVMSSTQASQKVQMGSSGRIDQEDK